MNKGYQLLEAPRLEKILRAFNYSDFLISILYWLRRELHIELKDQMAGAHIEVIKIAYVGAYPGLAIQYENPVDTPDLAPLIEATIDRFLREKPIIEWIDFLPRMDWAVETIKIMGERRLGM